MFGLQNVKLRTKQLVGIFGPSSINALGLNSIPYLIAPRECEPLG